MNNIYAKRGIFQIKYYMQDKFIGYLLLFIGIIIIISSAFNTYQVFTKKTAPIQLFSFNGISLNPSQLFPNLPTSSENSQLLKQKSTSENKVEIISSDMVNFSSNIFAHLMLMGFLATIGFKIASLGIMLIRPVVVHLKAKEITRYEPSLPITPNPQ